MVTRHSVQSPPSEVAPSSLRVGVLGAGLAGACVARALARNGVNVTVFDAAAEAATGASGNPIGILHPLVSKDHNLASQWVDHGMTTTLRWLAELSEFSEGQAYSTKRQLGHSCGVLELNDDATELVCWSPQGAWIRPAEFVKACLADAISHGARVEFNRQAVRVSPSAEIYFSDGVLCQFDHVVICTAQTMDLLLPSQTLMLNSIRGTISSYALDDSLSLPCVICADGYATPVMDGQMVVGASFERIASDEAAINESDKSNLDRLRVISASLAAHCASLSPVDRTSIRSATLDRMPHVGRVLDLETALTPQMSQLSDMPRNQRLWVLGGLGARGLSSAPLGATVIEAFMLGRSAPVSQRLLNAVDPVRFALRRHQRRK